jgi:NAD(P)-dependent dehydrogenase (short-subunit alcohol dehydrogenase family)
MRPKDKVAVIIGAGQSAEETLGNGRATVLWFAQEGARIFAADRDLDSANETAAIARVDGGECETARADVMQESELKAAIEAAKKRFGCESARHLTPYRRRETVQNLGVCLAVVRRQIGRRKARAGELGAR